MVAVFEPRAPAAPTVIHAVVNKTPTNGKRLRARNAAQEKEPPSCWVLRHHWLLGWIAQKALGVQA